MTTKITNADRLDLYQKYLIQCNYGGQVRFYSWWSDGIRDNIKNHESDNRMAFGTMRIINDNTKLG